MRKPRIAIIGLKGLPAFGGAARSMESIISLLNKKYDFYIYSIDTHTQQKGFHEGYTQIIFKGYSIKILNTFVYYWKCLFHALFFGNYDLIHLNHAESGFIVPFLRLKYKVVTTLHGVHTSERFEDKFNHLSNLLFKFFQFFTLRFSNLLISVSKYEIPFCKSQTKKPVIHIPNGIFVNAHYEKHILPYENYLLFAAARIYGIKGCDIMLNALKSINYQGHVLIIGDMKHDENHEALLHELSEGLNVTFIDLIKNKSLLMSYISNAKIFLFPSRSEAMSNMLLEVASLKCPIICSNIPANKDIFDESEVTFFATENPADLAIKLLWALDNKPLLEEKSKNAFEKLKEHYTWEQIAAEYDATYKMLLN
jgi:glycosyltransferase involved in cell wall biosynthesis